MNDHDQSLDSARATEQRGAELDAILAAANSELLDYVRARIGTRPRRPPQGHTPGRRTSDPAKKTCKPCACGNDLDLGLELSLQLTRAIDLSLDLALAIPTLGHFDHARALARVLSADLAAARDFEPDGICAITFTFAVDPPPEPDNGASAVSGVNWPGHLEAARMVGRSRLLDIARLIAHRLARLLVDDEAARLAHTVEWMLDRARDLELSRAIAGRVQGIAHIDASGADLSRLQLCAAAVPPGTQWSDQTVWPPHIADDIRALSHEVRPGTYRIDPREE